MLIKINDNVYINPEHVSAIAVAGAKRDGGVSMASITLHSGESFRVPADGVIETLTDAGVIDPGGAEAIALTDAEILELRELHEQGFRYIARDDDESIFAYVELPINDSGYWSAEGSDYQRLEEPYTCLPNLNKAPLSVAALLHEMG